MPSISPEAKTPPSIFLGSAAYPVKTRAIQAAVSAAAADAELKIDQASSQTPGIPPASLLASANTAPQMQFQYRFNEISGYGNYTVPAVGLIILQAVMLMGIGMSLGGWLWRHPRRKFVCDAVDRPLERRPRHSLPDFG